MVRTYHVCIWYQWIDHSRNALLPMYMNVPWVVLVTETHCGFHLVGFRNALLRLWWAISPQVHNHCTGGQPLVAWRETLKPWVGRGRQSHLQRSPMLHWRHGRTPLGPSWSCSELWTTSERQRTMRFQLTIVNIFVLCTGQPRVWSIPQVVIKATCFGSNVLNTWEN